MSEKNIRELALEAAQGSAPAFQELYRLTRQRAWFVALSITKNEDDAQDILQESYLKAFKNMERLDKPESFVSWLNQIVANQAKNYIARKKPDCFAQHEDENAKDWQEETDPSFIPDESLDRKEAKALIAALVNGLPEDQRLIVLLRYYDDMEVSAIAKSLEIPEGTVKSRLLRARKKLAAMLEQAQSKGLGIYAMAPIPLLAYFIKLLGFDTPGSDRLPPLLIGSAAAGTAAAGGAAAAGASAAAKHTAQAGKAGILSGKAVALAAATIITVGGFTAAGIYAYRKAAPTVAVTAAPVTETATDGYSESQAASNQFPTLLTPDPATAAHTQSGPPAAIAPPATADNRPGQTDTSTQAATPTTGQIPATTGNTSTATRSTGTTASTARTSFSFPTAPPYSRTPFPTLPRITTRPTTTTTTAASTTTTAIPTATAMPTTTMPVTTTAPLTTTAPTTTDAPTTTRPTTTRPRTTRPPTTTAPPDYSYDTDSAGGYVITKYNGSKTHVIVPAVIDGITMKHLGAGCFEGSNVVRVEISPGIDCLRARTFADCPNLEEVIVPNSVVSILGNPFPGSPKVVVVCSENSKAHKYAVANGIAYRLV